MANKYKLDAEMREKAGKGASRALRRDGKVPAVIYGNKEDAIKITLPAKEANIEYYAGHMFTTLCDLKVGNDTHLVLARDVQLHPVKDYVEHIDFLRVTPKTKITVSIPVNFIGEDVSPGIRDEGGSLNVVRYEVDLRCSATSIPDSLDADVSEMNIGDSLKISDVTLPEGATPDITDRDFTIATIIAPRAVVEEEDEEGLEGEEGEVAEGEEGEEASSEEGGEEASEE
ncbi:MAG: 50S ribosomal protein L25/general stress protein Ctc [Alphaproteobacteria bacterium]|jgi:large subunit ribosomal protein L25|nr:50S ribosomal protein L25/general stress protein Ctc [Alphaproteobacteria bacterium]MDP7222856.1 50S ribosomal protein L25/general stress protein Ctc [Alphaproteobacteria bacterium]